TFAVGPSDRPDRRTLRTSSRCLLPRSYASPQFLVADDEAATAGTQPRPAASAVRKTTQYPLDRPSAADNPQLRCSPKSSEPIVPRTWCAWSPDRAASANDRQCRQ